MIPLHRLNDTVIIINAELIESIETHGVETVVALVTGNMIVVKETVTDIIQKTIEYKKSVYATAVHLPAYLKGEGGSKSCH